MSEEKQSIDEKLDKHFSGVTSKEAWDRRRKMVYLITVFTLGYIFKVSFFSEVKPIHEVVSISLLTLTGSLIISWMFGSVIDDRWGRK